MNTIYLGAYLIHQVCTVKILEELEAGISKQFALSGLEQTKQCAISLISLGFPSFLP